MNTIDRLRRSAASQQQVASVVEGKWRTIRVCLDEDSGEFFNMGIVFSYANKVEVRMLDSFERVKCLFGSRVDHNDLTRLLHDIEEVVREDYSNLETNISDTIRLSLPLYASGESAESIVDEFYNDIITLGRPSEKASPNTFRYRHPSRIKETVFQIMEEKMFLRAASLIQQAPYEVAMPSGRSIEVNLPLMSTKAAGAITSAWYKSPIVAENNILQASSDLLLLANNTDISKISLSVLVPGRDSGLTLKEFNRLSDATSKQLERLDKAGVAILDATSVDVLANKTIDWWVDAA